MSKVYVKTDGPVPEYLTAGKVYEALRFGADGFNFCDDDAADRYSRYPHSTAHYVTWTLCDQHGNPVGEQGTDWKALAHATRPPDISVVTAEGMAQIKAAFGPDWKALAGELAEAAKLAESALAFIYGGEPLDPSGAIAALRAALAKYNEQEKDND
jgi:hypothetical protein